MQIGFVSDGDVGVCVSTNPVTMITFFYDFIYMSNLLLLCFFVDIRKLICRDRDSFARMKIFFSSNFVFATIQFPRKHTHKHTSSHAYIFTNIHNALLHIKQEKNFHNFLPSLSLYLNWKKKRKKVIKIHYLKKSITKQNVLVIKTLFIMFYDLIWSDQDENILFFLCFMLIILYFLSLLYTTFVSRFICFWVKISTIFVVANTEKS